MHVRELMESLLEYDLDDEVVIEWSDDCKADIDVLYKYHGNVLICVDRGE